MVRPGLLEGDTTADSLEMGIRMGNAGPWVFIHGDAAGFYPESYNKAAAPALILPRLRRRYGQYAQRIAAGSTANRRGVNPVTGQNNLPAALIGLWFDQSKSAVRWLVCGDATRL